MKRLDTEYRNREKKICIGKLSNAFRNRLKSFLKMISLRSFQIRTKIKGTSISRTRVRKKKKKIKQYPKNEEKIESLKSIKEFKRKRSERRKGRNYREGENWLDPGRKERLSHLNAVCRAGTFSRATILLSSPTILSTLCICVCVCVFASSRESLYMHTSTSGPRY